MESVTQKFSQLEANLREIKDRNSQQYQVIYLEKSRMFFVLSQRDCRYLRTKFLCPPSRRGRSEGRFAGVAIATLFRRKFSPRFTCRASTKSTEEKHSRMSYRPIRPGNANQTWKFSAEHCESTDLVLQKNSSRRSARDRILTRRFPADSAILTATNFIGMNGDLLSNPRCRTIYKKFLTLEGVYNCRRHLKKLVVPIGEGMEFFFWGGV